MKSAQRKRKGATEGRGCRERARGRRKRRCLEKDAGLPPVLWDAWHHVALRVSNVGDLCNLSATCRTLADIAKSVPHGFCGIELLTWCAPAPSESIDGGDGKWTEEVVGRCATRLPELWRHLVHGVSPAAGIRVEVDCALPAASARSRSNGVGPELITSAGTFCAYAFCARAALPPADRSPQRRKLLSALETICDVHALVDWDKGDNVRARWGSCSLRAPDRGVWEFRLFGSDYEARLDIGRVIVSVPAHYA